MAIKSVVIGTTGVLLVVLSALIAVLLSQPKKLVVVNQSDVLLQQVDVEIGNSHYRLSNIEAQATESIWYFYRDNDSGLKVELVLADGTKYSGSGGYITTGMHFQKTYITVAPNFKISVH